MNPDIDAIAQGSFKTKQPPEIKGTGYVVNTLECVLWGFFNSNSFSEGLLKIINLGDDADTTGAIYGQLAGCYYGESGIPKEWKDRLAAHPLLLAIAHELYALSDVKPWEQIDQESIRLSNNYLHTVECHQVLENAYKPILRKLLPGIHTYTTIDQFTADVDGLKKAFDSCEIQCDGKQELFKDFQQRLEADKTTLNNKLSRPKNPFAGGFGIKLKSNN